MPKICKRESEHRLALVKERVAAGFWSTDIAKELGLTVAAMTNYMSYHGIKSARGPGRPKKGAFRPTTTAARLAARKTEYNVTTSEPWQKADPAQFPDDIITEAQRMLRCSPQHAAWVLSCPKDFNPQHRSRIGNRGGSAIG